MPILVDIVTPERRLLSQEVDMVTLPGIAGQMGILRGHAPLLTTLDIGEIVLHNKSGQQYIAVHGGVVEVRPNKVTILADIAESAEDIDEARAQDARDRAQKSLAENPPVQQRPQLEQAIKRSNLRLRVAQRKRRGGPQFESNN
ncbi:MAG: F0F1 ATP synthase subunit epsilon [Caldilineaceae bacterium]